MLVCFAQWIGSFLGGGGDGGEGACYRRYRIILQ